MIILLICGNCGNFLKKNGRKVTEELKYALEHASYDDLKSYARGLELCVPGNGNLEKKRKKFAIMVESYCKKIKSSKLDSDS